MKFDLKISIINIKFFFGKFSITPLNFNFYVLCSFMSKQLQNNWWPASLIRLEKNSISFMKNKMHTEKKWNSVELSTKDPGLLNEMLITFLTEKKNILRRESCYFCNENRDYGWESTRDIIKVSHFKWPLFKLHWNKWLRGFIY